MTSPSGWISDCLKYETTVQLINESRKETMCQLTQINNFFMRIGARIKEFILQVPTLTDTQPEVQRPRSVRMFSLDGPIRERARSHIVARKAVDLDAPEPSRFESVHLCQLSAFKVAEKEFRSKICEFMATYVVSYDSRMKDVHEKMKSALASVTESQSRFNVSYDRYIKAGSDLKIAFDKEFPNFAEVKEEFIQAQKEAVEMHTHMNEVTAQTAMLMESALTQYEEIEAWRYEQFKILMTRVADWIDTFAGEIEKGNIVWSQLSKIIQDVSSIHAFMDCSKIIPPEADDSYQLVRLDRRVSGLLDKKEIFVEEQKKGMFLYKAVMDVQANGEYMSLSKGEVVVCLAERSDGIFAMNINESKGLIPLQAVVRI